ncbi:hypothetical protein FHS01_001641 [Longimicrobium terrae]|uniref:Uncharacterized protein n=1 Tax=Longimicrobium terrae TaxID=1639882 RepID=A0A841GWH2_9BACT|nr:hypothetical protein [Longimicrobium terrae]MBB6070023.1 hypothetical protein [Longimicrobium terrae]
MLRRDRRHGGLNSKREIVRIQPLEVSVEEPTPWEPPEPWDVVVQIGRDALDCVRNIPFDLHSSDDAEDLLVAGVVSAFFVGVLLSRFRR